MSKEFQSWHIAFKIQKTEHKVRQIQMSPFLLVVDFSIVVDISVEPMKTNKK